MLLWQPNKMATGHETQIIINAKYDSHIFTGYEENAI